MGRYPAREELSYLTRKQRQVLAYLRTCANDAQVAEVSTRDICRAIATSRGIICTHLRALANKGYIERLERGHGTKPSAYRLNGGVS